MREHDMKSEKGTRRVTRHMRGQAAMFAVGEGTTTRDPVTQAPSSNIAIATSSSNMGHFVIQSHLSHP